MQVTAGTTKVITSVKTVTEETSRTMHAAVSREATKVIMSTQIKTIETNTTRGRIATDNTTIITRRSVMTMQISKQEIEATMLPCLVIMKAVITQTMIGIAMPLAALITTIKEIIEQASMKDNTSVTALKEAANSIIENH